MKQIKITQLWLRIKNAEGITVHVPGSKALSKIVQSTDPVTRSGIIYKYRAPEDDYSEDIKITPRAYTTDEFTTPERVFLPASTDPEYKGILPEEESFDAEEFITAFELQQSVTSHSEFLKKNGLKYFYGFNLDLETLGEYAEYCPQTNELKTHLDRFED